MLCHRRAVVLYCTILLLFWLLCLRLYVLSKGQHTAMTVLDGQYSSRLDIAQRSGFVYDRYLQLLSHDECTGILMVNPAQCKDYRRFSQEISQAALFLSQSEIEEKLYEGVPFKVTVDSKEKGEKLTEKLDGVYYCSTYTENTVTAPHLLGYSRENRGVTGMRLAYNELLYGKLYAKNTAAFSGNALKMSMSPLSIDDTSYNSRDGIVTTIDKDLQLFCNSLEDSVQSGAVIVAEADSGEILALSSFPSYDASRLEDYLSSDKGELINKAASSYTPGSVFKIIVSAAALELSPSFAVFTHNCEGSIQVDDNVFRCHKASGHGELDMKEAFANSCNCYYVALAQQIGADSIERICRKLGLYESAKADFLTEAKCNFPSFDNRDSGYLANISFGQGDLLLSPMDMINVTSCAVGGYRVPLSLIEGQIEDGCGKYNPPKEKYRVFSDKTVQLLVNMMEECVNNGTGMSAKIEGAQTGGKTATAQTGRKDGNGVEYVHKWFCGFYRGVEKTYVFCILCDNTLENNLSPSVVSAHICRYLKENMY